LNNIVCLVVNSLTGWRRAMIYSTFFHFYTRKRDKYLVFYLNTNISVFVATLNTAL